jgi:hypothetical protein
MLMNRFHFIVHRAKRLIFFRIGNGGLNHGTSAAMRSWIVGMRTGGETRDGAGHSRH